MAATLQGGDHLLFLSRGDAAEDVPVLDGFGEASGSGGRVRASRGSAVLGMFSRRATAATVAGASPELGLTVTFSWAKYLSVEPATAEFSPWSFADAARARSGGKLQRVSSGVGGSARCAAFRRSAASTARTLSTGTDFHICSTATSAAAGRAAHRSDQLSRP